MVFLQVRAIQTAGVARISAKRVRITSRTAHRGALSSLRAQSVGCLGGVCRSAFLPRLGCGEIRARGDPGLRPPRHLPRGARGAHASRCRVRFRHGLRRRSLGSRRHGRLCDPPGLGKWRRGLPRGRSRGGTRVAPDRIVAEWSSALWLDAPRAGRLGAPGAHRGDHRPCRRPTALGEPRRRGLAWTAGCSLIATTRSRDQAQQPTQTKQRKNP